MTQAVTGLRTLYTEYRALHILLSESRRSISARDQLL